MGKREKERERRAEGDRRTIKGWLPLPPPPYL